MSKLDAKKVYVKKLQEYFETYKSLFVVNVDNVSSNQMHQIRHALRGKAVVVMGKNTQIRYLIKNNLIKLDKKYSALTSHVRGNIGFVFTSEDLKEIRSVLLDNKVAAPARAGAVAPDSVFVPGGNTGMEPGKTSFFQALGIPTKIARGTIEIVSDVELVKAGEKVGPSEATLLNMLGISPFTYGMTVAQVFDIENGSTFGSEVLDIEESSLVANLLAGIRDVASVSLAVGFPTVASVPHSIVNGYKNLLAVSVATDFTFEGSEKIKEYLENPEAFAVAAPAAAAAGGDAPAAEEKKAEEEEDSDEDMGFGLFD